MKQPYYSFDDFQFIIADLEPLVEAGDQLATNILSWETGKIVQRRRKDLLLRKVRTDSIQNHRVGAIYFLLLELSLLLDFGRMMKDAVGFGF